MQQREAMLQQRGDMLKQQQDELQQREGFIKECNEKLTSTDPSRCQPVVQQRPVSSSTVTGNPEAEDMATREGASTIARRRGRPPAASHSTQLPSSRVESLAKLPKVVVALPSTFGLPASFTRHSIRHILGGKAIKFVYVKLMRSASSLSKRLDIHSYVCASRTIYRWLPTKPGEHGFLEYDIGINGSKPPAQQDPRTKHRSNDGLGQPIIHSVQSHLFVGAGTGSPEVYHYCGLYRITRTVDLTKDEWSALPNDTKHRFIDRVSRLTPNMTRDSIRCLYNTGKRRMPCTRLECIEFNAETYRELVGANVDFADGSGSRVQPESTRPSKRRKVSTEEDSEGESFGRRRSESHSIDDMYA
ncbi:hypothetical protein C8Q76DRAFT_756535 [Earliella scabrosa]|nr:hypothetical protein C8Q76DRAFT_756535 [Earliella scabrosa]